jgi:hypothetical protein
LKPENPDISKNNTVYQNPRQSQKFESSKNLETTQAPAKMFDWDQQEEEDQVYDFMMQN